MHPIPPIISKVARRQRVRPIGICLLKKSRPWAAQAVPHGGSQG